MRACGACLAIVKIRALRCDLCGAPFEGPNKVDRLESFVGDGQGLIDQADDDLGITIIGTHLKIGLRPEDCPR